jgi:DNA-directed RNA polymerase specialized sigma24 family protein
MATPEIGNAPKPHAHASFAQTHWSVVRRAADAGEPGSRQALEMLCESCWYPIYAFVRRSGKSPEDAEDLTQGFLQRLIEKNLFASADREKGRLRTFLLACLKLYMADERDRAMAEKRGGGRVTTFSAEWAEDQFVKEPVDDLTPDRLYQRRWALSLLQSTVQTLEQRYAADGKAEIFTALSPFLGFSNTVEKYDRLAARLGMNLNTLKSHIRRLREDWRATLMDQVARTLDEPTPENIKAEFAELEGWV